MRNIFKKNDDFWAIKYDIPLEKGGSEVSGIHLTLPNWIETNSHYPYHTFIPGSGWGCEWMASLENLGSLYEKSAKIMKPILIFKLEGAIIPVTKIQDKNKTITECKFVKFTGETGNNMH